MNLPVGVHYSNNLRDWEFAKQFVKNQNLPESATAAVYIGENISKASLANIEETRSNAEMLVDSVTGNTDKLNLTLQDGLCNLTDRLMLGNVISGLGFLAMVKGLSEIGNKITQTKDSVTLVHTTIQEMQLENRFYAMRQSAAIQEILSVLRQSRNNEARQLVEQGESNFQKGYIEESLERFQKALEFDNTDFFIHYQMGLAFTSSNQLEQAEKSLLKAINFVPENSSSLRQLAIVSLTRVLINEKKFEEGLKYCHEALSIEAGTPTKLLEIEILINIETRDELENKIINLLTNQPQIYYILLTQPQFLAKIEILGPILQKSYDSQMKKLLEIFEAITESKTRLAENSLIFDLSQTQELIKRVLNSGIYNEIAECTLDIFESLNKLCLKIEKTKTESQSKICDLKKKVVTIDFEIVRQVDKIEIIEGQIEQKFPFFEAVNEFLTLHFHITNHQSYSDFERFFEGVKLLADFKFMCIGIFIGFLLLAFWALICTVHDFESLVVTLFVILIFLYVLKFTLSYPLKRQFERKKDIYKREKLDKEATLWQLKEQKSLITEELQDLLSKNSLELPQMANDLGVLEGLAQKIRQVVTT